MSLKAKAEIDEDCSQL